MTARGRAAACAKGRRKDGMLVNVKRNIPFSPPDISQAEIDEVADALRSGWITTGPKTKQFERDLAEFSHTTRFACFNSATARTRSVRCVMVFIRDRLPISHRFPFTR